MGLFRATRYLASIDMLEVEWLKSQGIRCVLMDRDNTCVPRDSKVAPPKVQDWIDRVHAAGIPTCVVSNNFHSKQVERSARELDSECIHHAMKPAPFAVRAALKRMGVSPNTDIIAGNLAGVRTVLVRPQCNTDLWYTHIMRIGERAILHGREFEGE